VIRVLVLYTDAGHGHQKSAEAIREELEADNLSNITIEVSNALDRTNPLFKRFYPAIYFRLILWAPWLWGFFFYATNAKVFYFFIKPLRSIWNYLQSAPLRRYLKEKNYDYVLSTHFFASQVSARLKRKKEIKSHIITIVTDVVPHRVWFNDGSDTYWVMAEDSAKVLRSFGCPSEMIKVGGIPISKQFLTRYHRPLLQTKFGLEHGRDTLLFSSGSFGLGPTAQILDSLVDFPKPLQVIVVCGNNQTLFTQLSRKKYPFPLALFGFVNNMHELMSVADLLIAKAGGMTTCESLAVNLPMILTSSIPGQETGNTNWLLARKAAVQAERPDQARRLIEEILTQPCRLEVLKNAARAIAKPHAAAEIIDFMLIQ
jgi:processive 1,2-diacylglycerol beta-glucosyltransferase